MAMLTKSCRLHSESETVNAQLRATSGPLLGNVFPVPEEGVSIGREPSNHISISGDTSVSRRHCRLQKEARQYRIIDLESRNGTFVNGVPATEQVLQNGDQIKIGESVFSFQISGPETPPAPFSVNLEETAAGAAPAALLRREDALYLQPRKVLDALPPDDRIGRDLNTLLKISTVIHSIRALDASKDRRTQEVFERQLLELIFEVIHAEHGAILLVDEDSGDFASLFGWDR